MSLIWSIRTLYSHLVISVGSNVPRAPTYLSGMASWMLRDDFHTPRPRHRYRSDWRALSRNVCNHGCQQVDRTLLDNQVVFSTGPSDRVVRWYAVHLVHPIDRPPCFAVVCLSFDRGVLGVWWARKSRIATTPSRNDKWSENCMRVALTANLVWCNFIFGLVCPCYDVNEWRRLLPCIIVMVTLVRDGFTVPSFSEKVFWWEIVDLVYKIGESSCLFALW